MGILVVLAAAAASLPASPPEKQATTIQAQFNEASELANIGKCQEAVTKLEALERDARVKPGSFPAMAMAARKGVCLVSLGRYNEGERAIAVGLPALIKAGPDFAVDVSSARMALGDAHFERSDRVNAARYYRLALEGRTGLTRMSILSRLTKAMAFDGNEAALEPAREALALLATQPKTDKMVQAAYHTLYARTLLNQSKAEEAYKELKQALSLSGGLTTRTSLDEVSLRGDLAMAAMLTRRKDDARLYLAYTGAGRIEDSPFARAETMDPPLCGSETGLRPEDIAVVEFGIQDDGAVMYARTVYSRGGPQVAAAFEQAVRQWYWRPEVVAKIPRFYRLAARIELRCSNRMGNRPGLWAPLKSRFMDWAARTLPAGTLVENRTTLLANLNRIADDQSNASGVEARIAAIGALFVIDPCLPGARADPALQLAATANIPGQAINWLRISQAAQSVDNKPEARRRKLLALAAEPAIAADALAVNTLLLDGAGQSQRKRDAQLDVLVLRAAQDERLPADHPLRQLAWLALANAAAAAGDLTQAQANFAKTGLTEEQCSLLSLPPPIRRTNVSGSDYPQSAAAMGFGGWVQLEYDINANGSTANVRPIVAYPALIFVDAATAIGKELQYSLSYRPGNATACSANANTIAFRMN